MGVTFEAPEEAPELARIGTNGSSTVLMTPGAVGSENEETICSDFLRWSVPGSNRRPPACKPGRGVRASPLPSAHPCKSAVSLLCHRTQAEPSGRPVRPLRPRSNHAIRPLSPEQSVTTCSTVATRSPSGHSSRAIVLLPVRWVTVRRRASGGAVGVKTASPRRTPPSLAAPPPEWNSYSVPTSSESDNKSGSIAVYPFLTGYSTSGSTYLTTTPSS